MTVGLSMSDVTEIPAQTVGLRQLREAAGLHVVALAAMLKVPVQKLEALEAGRYDELPDMTFARALASRVCRVLKADPAPILASLPQSAVVRLGEQAGQLNTPFPVKQEALMNADRPVRSSMRKPALFAAALLVAAAVLWWVLPMQTADVPQAVLISPPSTPEPVVTPAAPAVDVAALPAPIATPAVPAQAPVVIAVPATTQAKPVPSQSDATQLLQLRARQATWVQVRGASGQVLLERNLPAGESAEVPTGAPLAVVIGRAGDVDVSVRGQAMDIQPYTRNNVARFEVK